MFSIILSYTDETYNHFHNALDFHIREITYMQYQIIIKYSIFPESKDEIILDKDKLIGVTITPELSG